MKRILNLLLITLLLVGCSGGTSEKEPVYYEGVIQEKYFQRGSVSNGVGIGTNGQALMTTHATSDEYILFVNDRDFTVSKDVWFYLEKGREIRYQIGFFGNIHDIFLYDEVAEN